jgi:peptidoglycan/LPS O-acetylase OafA/YrhL
MNARPRVGEIDLLRFIAALAVVFFHYSFRGHAADGLSPLAYPALAGVSRYGYLGVELFFMISGFVILMTAARGSLRGFVISRMTRLYPAFWVCCTVTFLVIVLFGAPRFTADAGQYVVNMTMLSGFVGTPSMDGVYWSLFVEMRFYALVALILLLGKIHRAERWLLAWLVASLVLETIPAMPGRLRYLLITDYSAFFIAGATCFLIWQEGVSRARSAILALSWGLAVFQSTRGLDGFESHYRVPISALVVAGIITVFFLVMLLVALKRTGRISGMRWMLLGALTYPLYLVHQAIGYVIFNHLYPGSNPHLLLWGTVALMMAIAYLVNVQVEKRYAGAFKRQLNDGWASLQTLIVPAR